jgi:hypothetical protein
MANFRPRALRRNREAVQRSRQLPAMNPTAVGMSRSAETTPVNARFAALLAASAAWSAAGVGQVANLRTFS